MRYLYSICIILFSSLLWGQNNPFEVAPPASQFSVESPPKLDTIVKKEDNTEYSINIVDSEFSSSVEKDTSRNIFDIGLTPNVNINTSQQADEKFNAVSSKSDNENPFEISKRAIPFKFKTGEIYKSEEQIVDKPTIEPLSIEQTSDHFILWLNLLSIILIALITTRYNQTIKKIVNGVTNENVLSLNQRNEHNGLSLPYILLYIVSIIELTIFSYLLINNYLAIYGISIYIKILLIVALLIITKHFLIWSVGKIFNIDNITLLYNFRIQSYNILLGIILIPITLLMHYSPEIIANLSLYIGLIIISLIALLLYSRAILSSLNILKVNILHFLLYLCTFEIIPILILIKLVLNLNL